MNRPRSRVASAAQPAKTAPPAVAAPGQARPVKFTDYHVAESLAPLPAVAVAVQPFALPAFPPGVEPTKGALAQDEAVASVSQWAGQAFAGLNLINGVAWPGFAALAEMAQRPEYRKIARTLAEEATRKWITFQANGTTDKSERLRELEGEFRRLRVRDAFRRLAEQDAFFGRSHLYLDLKEAEGAIEKQTDIGDGVSATSRNKVGKGSLKGLRVVEPVWCYPSSYNTTDPLADHWYAPATWYVQGKSVHASRLLTFVSCEVPDLLKPSYAFGGVSISQQAKPYIDNWLRTRQGVSDLIDSFSDKGIKTDLASALANGTLGNLLNRLAVFANIRNNRGVMALDKDEEFFNVETSLGTLDKLQAQAIEQVAIVPGIPLVKLLGLTPSGLNASSDGEIRVFYDAVHAYQELFYGPGLNRVMAFAQLSLWGEIDPDITYSFNPLWSLDDKEIADNHRTRAETDKVLVDARIISRSEARTRLSHATDSPYPGLNPDAVPPPAISDAVDIAVKKATVAIAGHDAGLIGEGVALRALKDTGLFSGITDADVVAAEASQVGEPPAPEAAEQDDSPQRPAVAQDADPASLYVSRKLINANDLVAWAKGEGFTNLDRADKLHCTIAYSKTPVDWMKAGQAWGGEELRIDAGGPRLVEILGDKTVLLFASADLQFRWADLKAAGAAWDYPEYQPHVSFASTKDGIDLKAVRPFTGHLVFGPEIFERIDADR